MAWIPCSRAEYQERLELLPPAAQSAGGFLMGEAIDHGGEDGTPRYLAYFTKGARFFRVDRPMTYADFVAGEAIRRCHKGKEPSA